MTHRWDPNRYHHSESHWIRECIPYNPEPQNWSLPTECNLVSHLGHLITPKTFNLVSHLVHVKNLIITTHNLFVEIVIYYVDKNIRLISPQNSLWIVQQDLHNRYRRLVNKLLCKIICGLQVQSQLLVRITTNTYNIWTLVSGHG